MMRSGSANPFGGPQTGPQIPQTQRRCGQTRRVILHRFGAPCPQTRGDDARQSGIGSECVRSGQLGL